MSEIIHNAISRRNNLAFAPLRARKSAQTFELEPAGETRISMGMQPADYAPILILNELSFIAWVSQAAAGDVLQYFRGHLALDIEKACTRLSEHDRLELVKLASRAMWAAENGQLHLVQRRNAPGDFSYLAIARPRPPHAAPLSKLLLEEAAR
jgi:hypothetical protein